MKIFLSLLIVLIISGCSNTEKKQCEFSGFEIMLEARDGLSDNYSYWIYLPSYNRNCIDSSIVANLAYRVRSKIDTSKVIRWISFFSSSDGFEKGSLSQHWKVVRKNHIVTIVYNNSVFLPSYYIFYGKNGDAIYKGTMWPSVIGEE